MKCLSVKQPYAELIVSGRKTIELRKWNTKFRGEFLVHASLKPDIESCRMLKIDPSLLVRGAIIGKATIYGVKIYKSREEFTADKKKHFATSNRYSDHRYGFLLKDAEKFKEPYPFKGALGFFNASTHIIGSKAK